MKSELSLANKILLKVHEFRGYNMPVFIEMAVSEIYANGIKAGLVLSGIKEEKAVKIVKKAISKTWSDKKEYVRLFKKGLMVRKF